MLAFRMSAQPLPGPEPTPLWLVVVGFVCAAACIWLLVGIIIGRHRDPEYGINWPVVTRYVIYAAIVGMLLMVASNLFPQVQS